MARAVLLASIDDALVWTVSARPMGLLGSGAKAAVALGSSIGLAL